MELKSVEDELEAYLRSEAKKRGFSQAKTRVWVDGMRDLRRGLKIVPRILDSFAIYPQANDIAVDIGCGFGGVVKALLEKFNHVSALDIEADRVEWTRLRAPSAEVKCASATCLPWPDKMFRLAITNDVYEHLTYSEQDIAASELFRILVSGGVAFVDVPNKLQLIDEHNFIPFATWLPSKLRCKYVEVFSREEKCVVCYERTVSGWVKLFKSHGFIVRKVPVFIRNYSFLPAQHWQLYLQKP